MFRCVIRGCVPKKILVYAAQFRGEFEVWSWPHIATDLVSLLLSNSAKSCGLCDVNCNEILSLSTGQSKHHAGSETPYAFALCLSMEMGWALL